MIIDSCPNCGSQKLKPITNINLDWLCQNCGTRFRVHRAFKNDPASLGRQAAEKKCDQLLEKINNLQYLLLQCQGTFRTILHSDCPQCKEESKIMLSILKNCRSEGLF